MSVDATPWRPTSQERRSARSLVPAPSHSIFFVVVVGTVLTLAAAIATSMPGPDLVELVVLAGGTAIAGAAVAIVLVSLVRHRSVTVQTAATAFAALVPVLIGVCVGARSMLLDDRAFEALLVVLCAAGTIAIVTALVLGRRVGRASDSLIEATRRLGEGSTVGHVADDSPEDLTRLHRALEQMSVRLDEGRERERALERSRRELIAWVSHDLRTPLAGLKVLAEALEDGVADDARTVARYHRAIGVEVDRLSGLVDDLFELSRAQAGVLQLEFARISLGDLVSDALESASPVAAAKRVRLEGCLAAEPEELHVSAPEVLRALRNLVENAIRHTPADGTVTIEAGVEQGQAFVSVLDHGGGIAEGDLTRVFDVGYRANAARTPGEGAGLGLAIARGLVEAHHGELMVANENGGARFTMRLPLVPLET
jgi:signal transduction histidine kinase